MESPTQAASRSDVAPVATETVNFDEDTLKGEEVNTNDMLNVESSVCN